jgi:hypothetical protein
MRRIDYSLGVVTRCIVVAMTIRAARAAVLPGVLSLLLLAAPAANAQSLSVDDPTGDAPAGELDLTRVTVQNRDHRVVATVETADLTKGSVIVSLDRRKGAGVRLVTTRRADGTVKAHLYAGAFTDTGVPGTVVPCPRYRATWDDDADSVTLSMPSRCWNGGDYGALRFAALTEKAGADSDSAPTTTDGDNASSAWVARG